MRNCLIKCECHRTEINGIQVTLYTSEYKGKKFTGTFEGAYLFALGYGSDNAAELKYVMDGGNYND